MLSAFSYDIWNLEKTRTALVIAKDEKEAEEKLSPIISEDEDYELNEKLDYANILI